jgi:hypothetical protein
MRLSDFLSMYGRELDEVCILNRLEDRRTAFDAVRHEVYARKNLFGLRPFFRLPEDLDLDQFERDMSKVFIV